MKLKHPPTESMEDYAARHPKPRMDGCYAADAECPISHGGPRRFVRHMWGYWRCVGCGGLIGTNFILHAQADASVDPDDVARAKAKLADAEALASTATAERIVAAAASREKANAADEAHKNLVAARLAYFAALRGEPKPT